MTQQSTNLQRAELLLREGRKEEARAVLMGYLRKDPSSARAWWLLSFALTDLRQQAECVERVLQMSPENMHARDRLSKLKSELAAARTGPSRSQPTIAPFFPEDIAPLPGSTPLEDSFRSSQTPSPFLPEEENPPRPALTAFERSFPASDALHPFPEPASFLPEANASPRPRKKASSKKNTDLIKYAILIGIFLCACTGISIGFFIVLRNQRSADVSPPVVIIPDTPTPISTQALPPTWTPAPTNTLFPTSTLALIQSSPTPVFNQIGTQDPGSSGTGLSVGMQAPDFKLKNANTGNQVSLSDFKGHLVILFFWANGCGYCDIEAEAMQDIYKEYKGDGIVVLAVDVWGDSDHARAYRDNHNLTYPMLTDPKASVYKLYGGNNWFPLNYFVDVNGNVSFSQLGMMDYSMLNLKVRSMLNLIPTVAP